MENAKKPTENHYMEFLKIVFKVSLVIILMSFIVYTKPSLQPDNYKLDQEKEYKSSVSVFDGKYVIDSNVILSNTNKKTLLAELKEEYLIRKTTKEEIPPFLVTFLDSISINKKFTIANSWEKYSTGD